MKYAILAFALLAACGTARAQNLTGSWEIRFQTEGGQDLLVETNLLQDDTHVLAHSNDIRLFMDNVPGFGLLPMSHGGLCASYRDTYNDLDGWIDGDGMLTMIFRHDREFGTLESTTLTVPSIQDNDNFSGTFDGRVCQLPQSGTFIAQRHRPFLPQYVGGLAFGFAGGYTAITNTRIEVNNYQVVFQADNLYFGETVFLTGRMIGASFEVQGALHVLTGSWELRPISFIGYHKESFGGQVYLWEGDLIPTMVLLSQPPRA